MIKTRSYAFSDLPVESCLFFPFVGKMIRSISVLLQSRKWFQASLNAKYNEGHMQKKAIEWIILALSVMRV